MVNEQTGIVAIRAAAEKQKKLQLLAADGSLKGTTVAYEMAKLSDEILRSLDAIEGVRGNG